MPYMYELRLAEGQPNFTFMQQLVPAGTLVGTRQAVAVLSDGTMDFRLPAPTQGLLVAWFVEGGAEITPGLPLARIVCAGDEVAVEASVPDRVG